MIPQDVIDRVRESIDITELVSEYVNLRKRGANFQGLCPFHNEKTPSFSVSPERQIFHCFGCGEGGNAITFLMKIEKITFMEAVEQLAKKAGIALQHQQGAAGTRTNLYEITENASRTFHKQLLNNPEGEAARSYLKKRNISADIITDFMLGYALDDWDGIQRRFLKLKNHGKLLEQVGLVIERKTGRSYYGRFRHRIIFPIRNESGRVVGFGGRRLREDDSAKYINSPETVLYQKGKILYGLFEGKEAVRQAEEVIIVEGYMDLLAMCQAGFRNVAAPLGTALTSQQAGVLARYANRLVFLFDSDEAGLRATLRGLETTLNRGLDVQVGILESGSDPDSYIQKYGSEGMQKVLDKRLSLAAFWASIYQGEKAAGAVADKARFVKSIVKVLAKVEDTIYQSLLVREISERFGISESAFHKELHSVSFPRSIRPPIQDRPEETRTKDVQTPEWDMLRLIITKPEVKEFILKHCPADHFKDADARMIMENIHRLHREGGKAGSAELINVLTDVNQQNLVAQIEMEQHKISQRLINATEDNPWEKACKEIVGFKIRMNEEKRNEINKRILDLQREGESTHQLTIEFIKTTREIARLKKEGIEELLKIP